MLLTDSNEKTARIPVRMIDGKFINRITGEELSGIKNNALCEIVVQTDKVTDDILLESLMREDIIELLPAETKLLVSVSPKKIPEELKKFAFGQDEKEKWVEVYLITSLVLKFRGTKQPSLLDCDCEIPALKETNNDYSPAESLNHAYRLISTAFGPYRRSYGGSVFLKVKVPLENEIKKLTSLKYLREVKVEEYFETLKENYQKSLRERENSSLF